LQNCHGRQFCKYLNYLLNPLHPRFAEIEIGASTPYPVDPRLASE